MRVSELVKLLIELADNRNALERAIFQYLLDHNPSEEWWEEVASGLENENYHKEAHLVRGLLRPR